MQTAKLEQIPAVRKVCKVMTTGQPQGVKEWFCSFCNFLRHLKDALQKIKYFILGLHSNLMRFYFRNGRNSHWQKKKWWVLVKNDDRRRREEGVSVYRFSPKYLKLYWGRLWAAIWLKPATWRGGWPPTTPSLLSLLLKLFVLFGMGMDAIKSERIWK